MIRFLFLNAFLAIHTIIFCSLAVILSFFDKSKRTIRYYVSMPWAKVSLWVCGIRVQVQGMENIKDHIPYVFMCNHQSYFDIFALLAYLPADFKFILKSELMQIPIFGMALKRAGHISIKREKSREAIRRMDQVAAKIKSGTSVLIFPEGTRSKDGQMLPLKKGGFHMAMKSGCNIVPIGIKNSYRIVVKDSLKINKGTFSIRFGKPISISDFGKKDIPDLMKRVRQEIALLME